MAVTGGHAAGRARPAERMKRAFQLQIAEDFCRRGRLLVRLEFGAAPSTAKGRNTRESAGTAEAVGRRIVERQFREIKGSYYLRHYDVAGRRGASVEERP